MNDGDDDFLGAAYHEAGHAVVALALGLRVARVEVVPEDHSGATDVEPADHLPIEDRIALCVGGMNANDMFNAPTHDLATFGDHVLVLELIRNVNDADGDVLRDKGHQRAWDLLKAHASGVEDIAMQLLIMRKIDLTGYILKR